MKNTMRKTLMAVVTALSFPVGAQQTEQTFLDGFPDVPLVAGIRDVDGESVLFDTPSGTIAEVKLLVEGGADHVFDNFKEALAALGWSCAKKPQALTCEREKNRLVFFDTDPRRKNGTIILRLEPIK